MVDVDTLRGILACPQCRQGLEYYSSTTIRCPNCNQEVTREGRLLDFSRLTPDLPIEFAKYKRRLYDFAGEVMRDVGADWRVQSVLEMVRRRGTGSVCLEIGGADGPMTPTLEALYSTVLTIDISKTFLKRIESKTTKTVCLYGDAHFLPIQDRAADVVVCSEILEHALIPTQLLLEIRRVMKVQGRCILSVPNEAARNSWGWRKTRRLPAMDSHINFYNVDTLKKLLFRMGLDVVEIKTLSAPQSLRRFLRHPVTYVLTQLSGLYILCSVRVMDDPTIYWELLEERIGAKP